MTNELKITLVAIHHTHKLDSSQPLSIHTMAGSRILSQEADFIIGMNTTIGKQRYIKDVAFRYANDSNEKVKIFDLDEFLWVNVKKEVNENSLLTSTDGRKNDTNKMQIIDFLEKSRESGLIATSEMMSQFVQSKQMSKQTLHNQLGELAKEGIIEKLRNGEYRFLNNLSK